MARSAPAAEAGPHGPASNRRAFHEARIAAQVVGSRRWRLAVADWFRAELAALPVGADPGHVLVLLRDLNQATSERCEGTQP